MTPRREAIISIRPTYAQAILMGRKTVELRRRIPSISVGTRLWIYATRPVGAVIGTATVEDIVRGSPEEIWGCLGQLTEVERADFDSYFDGATEAIGILLAKVRKSKRQVGIGLLRVLREGFHPPQVIMWLNNDEAQFLRRAARID